MDSVDAFTLEPVGPQPSQAPLPRPRSGVNPRSVSCQRNGRRLMSGETPQPEEKIPGPKSPKTRAPPEARTPPTALPGARPAPAGQSAARHGPGLLVLPCLLSVQTPPPEPAVRRRPPTLALGQGPPARQPGSPRPSRRRQGSKRSDSRSRSTPGRSKPSPRPVKDRVCSCPAHPRGDHPARGPLQGESPTGLIPPSEKAPLGALLCPFPLAG